MIKAIQRSSSDVKKTNLKVLMENVSAYFDSISYVLEYSADIVLRLMEEQRENLEGDMKFYFLLAMTMRAKQCNDWFKPQERGELQKINPLKNFSYPHVSMFHKCFSSQETALRIYSSRQCQHGEVLAQFVGALRLKDGGWNYCVCHVSVQWRCRVD